MKVKVIFLILAILFNSSIIFAEEYLEPLVEKGIVLEADEPHNEEDLFEAVKVQNLRVKISSGKYKGQVLDIENHLSDNPAYDILLKKGDKVIVMIEESEGGFEAYVADFQRSNYILYLAIFFIVIIILIGKMKGLKAVISLALTVLSIFYILLPQILKGGDPIPISIVIAIGVTIITTLLVSGFNYKSLTAILGTSLGVIIAGLVAYYVGHKAHLTGLSSEEATMLMYIPQDLEFNFKNLLFSGIILGALGAVMDVAMSIASSIDEIHSANPSLSTKELFKSGMNVGKDIMGTMTNTLILAYAGSSIPLLLLFMAYNTSIVEIMNLDIIATEAVRSLAGSIGLVLTIPVTAVIGSVLTKKQNRREEGD